MERVTLFEKARSILGLSKTDLAIIRSLSQGRRLLVSDIARETRRSRRHVCHRLSVLLEKGLLKRELQILQNKRIAYRYSLSSMELIAQRLRDQLLRTLSELESV